jgi:hypothetical protein
VNKGVKEMIEMNINKMESPNRVTSGLGISNSNNSNKNISLMQAALNLKSMIEMSTKPEM